MPSAQRVGKKLLGYEKLEAVIRFLYALIPASIPSMMLAQAPGILPAWELQKKLDVLVAQSKRLTPLMDEIKVPDWIAQGAPTAYADQLRSARNEAGYLAQTSSELSQEPEKMTKTLETYFRLQALESLLDSLSQGVRQYQNPALADLIQGVISENNNHRGWLRGHLVDLVATKEVELGIMTKEAQRCQSEILRRPRPAPPKRKSP